ncbi:MAG: alpha/beta fold hydrolase [Rhodospirillales bacterium]
MPYCTTNDGVKLYYEEAGEGTPILFVHEFAGDYRSWEPQVRHFSHNYRCITFSARGFTPSDVPADPEMYSQDIAREDIKAVLDSLDIQEAHVIGLSMGGFSALHFGMHYPDRVLSQVIAGCGYGADEGSSDQFKRETAVAANRIETETMAVFGASYAVGPTRVQFQNKDPRGWKEFETQLCEHSSLGSANTMRGVQGRRPSLYALKESLQELTVPTLVLNGDEDDPCLGVSLFLKQAITSSALSLIPRTGHTCNLEEPALFNQTCETFIHQVECGRWTLRDPRSMTSSIISAEDK